MAEKKLADFFPRESTCCVRLVGSYTDPTHLGLIMEPAPDSDLATFLTAALHDRDKKSLLRSFFGCTSRTSDPSP
ncbi:hypothetical protein VTN77DRAFT_1598 [Rasamsonia byssochlamydoides]|uniref:uncharacterized protein n=1 Tax=Rasamsonia byssochlamydoides TaxID=89139 RepID=UPI0037449376